MENISPDYKSAEVYILAELEQHLSPLLKYHNLEHTKGVMRSVSEIALALGIGEKERKLLQVAAAFHDAGFMHVYKNHEERGCVLVREYLPTLHFNDQEIDTICGMIMATKIPQSPNTILEQIIADADLDYLANDDAYNIAENLFEELQSYTALRERAQWMQLQADFLTQHHYHTEYSRQFREPGKQRYLQLVRGKIKSSSW